MALPTIQDLENLFPFLANQRRAISNQTRNGRRFTERELGDAISKLLTRTQSVNSNRTRQTAIAAGDSELLAQTQALENLIGEGVLQRMEEFLNGTLEAGSTDDLIDQFNELNEIVEKVTKGSPVAISNMIRAQVKTLRSDKTSAARKAQAISNFQTVSGESITDQTVEQLIQSIENESEDIDRLVEQMEAAAMEYDRMVEADAELESSLRDLINGIESGLVEDAALNASISELMPTLEDSSINLSDEMRTALMDNPSLEVLKQILKATEDSDIGNIDSEKRKQLNLGSDENFRDKVSNLTPDIVKSTAESGKGLIFDLLKGGAILALLGSTGMLSQIGSILKKVGALAFNFIKESLMPDLAEAASSAMRGAWDWLSGPQALEFSNTMISMFKDVASYILDPIFTFGKTLTEIFNDVIVGLMNKIPGVDIENPSTFRSAQDFVSRTGQQAIATNKDGLTIIFNENGDPMLADQETIDMMLSNGVKDMRKKENSPFVSALDSAANALNRGPMKAVNKAIEEPAQGFLDMVLGDPMVKAEKKLKEEQERVARLNQQSEIAAKVREAGNGASSSGGGIQSGIDRMSSASGVRSGSRGSLAQQTRLAPSPSVLGGETMIHNANPGSTLD